MEREKAERERERETENIGEPETVTAITAYTPPSSDSGAENRHQVGTDGVREQCGRA